MNYFAGDYDVAVIGAGHAGIEAALSAARLGVKTVVFTINLDMIGNMPCNPSIGGTAKGHLVRELDALGGEMGKAADATTLQSRMLNRGKGPAVHSLRAQIDRREYAAYMKHALEKQKDLLLKQAEITELFQKDEKWHVVTKLNAEYTFKKVVLATGVYLRGRIFVGEVNYSGGPDGTFAATSLTDSLQKLGLPLRRFKTGTPARVLKSSVDLDKMEIQHGDENPVPFSYDTCGDPKNTAVCYIAYTNDETKQIILDNLHRSPLYSGDIKGVGPRYCPSIEDKIVRFADKKRHQLFVEPCGESTEEMYLQGMSSSLPEEVQIKIYHSIKGLEHCSMTRNAYAIEYDCIDPLALSPTLEIKAQKGLYGAGQFNGSSGYEEAAAQGFVAGVNAALSVLNKEPFILSRSSSYIGTLIDDLVTKGCSDPYRMMTSRSEYRLLLRQDNADERLMPSGRELGLIGDEKWQHYLERKQQKEDEIKRLKSTTVSPKSGINDLLVSRETSPLNTGCKIAELLCRPQISYADLAPFDKERPQLSTDVADKVEIEIKYEGYIKRQEAQVEEVKRLENRLLPKNIDYKKVGGLRLEAVEKLEKIMPHSIGQASRISGVSPADISVLLIYLEKTEREETK